MKASKFTLLVVDDSEDDQILINRAFEDLGAKYITQNLCSGNEAIAYLKGEGKFADRRRYEFPSYILTDLKMAPGDGFHLLEFLKNNPALSVIPVVMFSASEDSDDIRHAYLLGASSYMVKPGSIEALRLLLRKIHEYWAECEIPEVDPSGYALPTSSTGRLGARYRKPAR